MNQNNQPCINNKIIINLLSFVQLCENIMKCTEHNTNQHKNRIQVNKTYSIGLNNREHQIVVIHVS